MHSIGQHSTTWWSDQRLVECDYGRRDLELTIESSTFVFVSPPPPPSLLVYNGSWSLLSASENENFSPCVCLCICPVHMSMCPCLCALMCDMALNLVLSGASFVSESNDNGSADPDVDNSTLTACGDVDSQTTATQPVGMLTALFTCYCLLLLCHLF